MNKLRIRIGASVDEKIYSEFKKISHKTKIPVSRLLDESMILIIEKSKNGEELISNLENEEE